MAEALIPSNLVFAWLKKGQQRSKQTGLLFHYIFVTIPLVSKLLDYWEWEASLCPDEELRKQALASIKHKSFHCQGGAFFAVPYAEQEPVLLELIVAYQTLCDYLDNLCDRANCTNEEAFFQLHTSLMDALSPGNCKQDYYRDYPYKNDGGYINKLVDECQSCLARLPSYNCVSADAIQLAQLYISLQAYKHIEVKRREIVLREWAESCLELYPELQWQEFAAASGSTLGIFKLFGMASVYKVESESSHSVVSCYFPWVCGLHILLDYLIDQEEDRTGGDLNFTFYYPDQQFMLQRLQLFITRSMGQVKSTPDQAFTCTVVEGLLAMYLSDPKVQKQGMESISRKLIKTAGRGTASTLYICKIVRRLYLRF